MRKSENETSGDWVVTKVAEMVAISHPPHIVEADRLV
jgi:hypothetical protein